MRQIIIALAIDGSDINSNLAAKLGIASHFILFNTETSGYEFFANAGAGQSGAGAQAVVFIISKNADVLLASYCSPNMKEHLTSAGIEVVDGVSGTAREALDRYINGEFQAAATETETRKNLSIVYYALRQTFRQFGMMLPIMISVVLIMGLVNAFVPKADLAGIFSGHAVWDTLQGAWGGSIFAGNPVSSYVIGGELLDNGVSLFAVTAFMLTWVMVGLIQLPAEIAAMGKRFAILRNALSFLFAVAIAIIVASIINIR